jgi:hypothetical protein
MPISSASFAAKDLPQRTALLHACMTRHRQCCHFSAAAGVAAEAVAAQEPVAAAAHAALAAPEEVRARVAGLAAPAASVAARVLGAAAAVPAWGAAQG